MDLINNCTLFFDIEAIVLHTNLDTMGKRNHVVHISRLTLCDVETQNLV